ncbi:putative Cubilin [Hypsibius exemplaris]|uniref:Cubilin n=1 Tax=Hypsibius exemplaris TaxID=2072580 RepID=A0A1W0WZE1_HYPEX|nr:putative Cubilin [Hypsibius exemplaris]
MQPQTPQQTARSTRGRLLMQLRPTSSSMCRITRQQTTTRTPCLASSLLLGKEYFRLAGASSWLAGGVVKRRRHRKLERRCGETTTSRARIKKISEENNNTNASQSHRKAQQKRPIPIPNYPSLIGKKIRQYHPHPSTATAVSSSTSSTKKSWLLLMLYCACVCCCCCLGPVSAFDCDFTRVSGAVSGPKTGAFASPLLNGHTVPAYGLQCIYTFIALPTERVKLAFRDFNLAGRPPDCLHEYIDLYTELRNATEDLVQTDKFGGRFCGKIAPRPRISLYNTIVLVFSFDRAALTPHLFAGTYEFINASMYDMGTPAPPSTCAYVVKSWVKRAGDIVSPTYPGVYPQRIMCSYQFLGQRSTNQRVRIEFMDFDLFSGGAHCPYDRLTIHDGATEQDPVISTNCGPQRGLIVFSSQENLFISFITNRSGGENRGFHAIFEFSENYVNLEFITAGEHVRGTECDQRILSTGRSNGIIKSPNSPFLYQPNVECRYFIEGLNNAEDLERVRLTVEMFRMPQLLGAEKGDCSAGGLTVWFTGVESRSSGPSDTTQTTLCGTPNLPLPALFSADSKILLKFYSGTTQGLGFRILYQFETYFKVPGIAHPDSNICEFRFQSGPHIKSGDFHSPRHPANYPPNTNCTYIFEGAANEQARLEFDLFRLSGDGNYNNDCQNQDYVDIFETSAVDSRQRRRDMLIGRYCGTAMPAPIISRFGVHDLKLRFVTDATGVTNGFRGRYMFQPAEPTFSATKGCGENIRNQTHGRIAFPDFPDGEKSVSKYTVNASCEWWITVRPGYNVLVNLTFMGIEGSKNFQTCSATSCGCSGAALKVFTDLTTDKQLNPELCGVEATDIPNGGQLRSPKNVMRLTFTTSSKATGGDGFALRWNEVRHPVVGDRCEADEFFCDKNKFCINKDLRCDGHHNCGEFDGSDESVTECGEPEVEVSFFEDLTMMGSVGGAVGGVLLIVIVMVVCVCRRRRKAERRRKRQQNMNQDQHHEWNS